MRLTTLLLFAFFSCNLSFAQTEKGKAFMGNQNLFDFVNIRSFKTHGQSGDLERKIGISPTIGYFIADDFAVGLLTSYTISQYTNTTGRERVVGSAVLSPFIRSYFGDESWKPFLEFGIGIRSDQTGYIRDDWKRITTANMFTFSAGAGVSYFIHPKISLDFGLGYSHGVYFSVWENENGERRELDSDYSLSDLRSYLSFIYHFNFGKKTN